MIGEMFLFEKFDKASLKREMTEKQMVSFKSKLMKTLLTFNNNKAITEDYLNEHLKIDVSSAKFSKNDNPSRPFVFIDINFMLESTLIETQVSAEFNSACCRIPLTYYKYEIKIKNIEHSDLLNVLNLYRPKAGASYFYFGGFRQETTYTVTFKHAFKFQHHFIKQHGRDRFYIEYKIKDHKFVTSQIIDDTNDDYVTYPNKALSAQDETLFINFANLAYTKQSAWVNTIVKDSINFKDIKCFAELKTLFLSLYTGEHRETLVNELMVFEMAEI